MQNKSIWIGLAAALLVGGCVAQQGGVRGGPERPDIVLSANGACRAQLAQALFDAGSDIRVMHPAELVAEYLDEPAR